MVRQGPRSKARRAARNGTIDIFFAALSHLGHDLAGRWIVDGEGLARSGGDPLAHR